MKKFLSYTQIALSLIAIVLSIVAICVTYPRSQDSSLDYIGIIIGILGVLVTVLVGWQLYNALNLKELVAQTKKAKEDAIEAKETALSKVETIQQRIDAASKRLNELSANIKGLKTELDKKANIEDVGVGLSWEEID